MKSLSCSENINLSSHVSCLRQIVGETSYKMCFLRLRWETMTEESLESADLVMILLNFDHPWRGHIKTQSTSTKYFFCFHPSLLHLLETVWIGNNDFSLSSTELWTLKFALNNEFLWLQSSKSMHLALSTNISCLLQTHSTRILKIVFTIQWLWRNNFVQLQKIFFETHAWYLIQK